MSDLNPNIGTLLSQVLSSIVTFFVFMKRTKILPYKLSVPTLDQSLTVRPAILTGSMVHFNLLKQIKYFIKRTNNDVIR